MAVSRVRNEKYAIKPLIKTESSKLSRLTGKRDRGTRWLWGRYHVLHNFFIVQFILFHSTCAVDALRQQSNDGIK